MRICHAFLFFSIKFAGGTSDLMYKICKAQIKSGHKPVIYSGDHKFDQELADSLQGAEFNVTESKLDKAGFSIMPKLKDIADKEVPGFDVVHLHVFRTFQNYVLWKACMKHNVPFIMDAHGAVPYGSRKPVLKRLFDKFWGRQMLRDAAFCVAETKVGVDEYKEIVPDLPDEQIVVISPPFDTDEFEKLPEKGQFRKEYGIAEDERVIMFLGRVHHIKGNDFLIKGFAEYAKNDDKAKLVIVGPDGGHMDECKQIAKDLGVESKVMFAGFLGGDKKNSALIDADIVCQMSRQEQGAWAPFEAVLCGTPIIVTEHTGAGEDVKRVDAGYTVKFDDNQDLADKFKYVFDNYDAAKEKTMKAKTYIETHMSMNARSKEYIELYERAIEKAKNKGGAHVRTENNAQQARKEAA